MREKHWCKFICEATEAERMERMQTKTRWRDAWRKVKEELIEDAQTARERQEKAPWQR